MRIGVISDTHNFFDAEIPSLFAGVEHIIHAGDIGQPAILQALEEIAPVTAVAGNTDDPGFRYPLTEVVELGGLKFLVHHIVDPRALEDSLQSRIKRVLPDVVVFGHSHKPFCETVDGILFFNPGAAGKARFGLPRTLAVLHCTGKKLKPEFHTLKV